jgi:ABC-type dipeptide/oligopeptide/nickel transport system ATPase component
MSTLPLSNTEFKQIIVEKSQNFTNCEFIFAAINDFLHKYDRGYFTIVGSPGSGKSAILAKFVSSNPNQNINIIYYNAQIENKNTAEEFLKYVCSQLIEKFHNSSMTPPQPSPLAGREQDSSFPPYTGGQRGVLPDNATEGSWFLSLLLQQISDELEPNQKLIIAIDALDAINPDNQPLGTNLFYLPRYLPQGVYFLLTRRPFKIEKSGLLIEAPSQILDLSQHDLKNWDDEQEFTQHWQKMQAADFSDIAVKILRVLTSAQKEKVSMGWGVNAIAQTINEDAYEVEEVLENWFEFLRQQKVDGEICYSLYHPNFADWLLEKIKIDLV